MTVRGLVDIAPLLNLDHGNSQGVAVWAEDDAVATYPQTVVVGGAAHLLNVGLPGVIRVSKLCGHPLQGCNDAPPDGTLKLCQLPPRP